MRSRAVVVWSMLSALFVVGCGRTAPGRAAEPEVEFRLAGKDRVRVVVIGDTGAPGPDIEALHAAVKAEPKDLVIVVGDLVYPLFPECPDGTLGAPAREALADRAGAVLGDLGAPVLAVLGNHDVGPPDGSRAARVACLTAWAGQQPAVEFPGPHYVADLGVAALAVLDTNTLTDAQAGPARRLFDAHGGWRLVAGHHVLRTFHDKDGEDEVRPWLAKHGLKPDVYLNGHAHLLQLGVYDGIVAVTSGSTALPREQPACPPACGEGQLWGKRAVGYAVVELTAEVATITFRDTARKDLFRHELRRAAP